jgi:uncharacterized protein DUF1828
MSLSPDRIQSRLANAVGGVVEVRPHSENVVRIEAPFTFADGDHLVIRLRRQNSSYEWTDLGHTLMHLSYDMDYDAITSGKRGQLLESSLLRAGLQNRDGELVLEATDADLGESLLRFAQGLIHVSDLDYLSQERVKSTFIEDLLGLLEERFKGRTQRDYHDPEHDPKGEYPVDLLINHSHQPVAVFALLNDDRCRDATITLQQLRAWERPTFSTGVFEDQEKINRKVLARLSNACDKQFASLAGQENDIVRYIERVLRPATAS